MMAVHKIGGEDVTGYARYLTSQNADRRGDYYLGAEGRQVEGVGTWHGKAAAELGLTGEVSRDDLMRLWEGKDPSTGEIVVRRSAKGDHVAAVDCTFSAPKSVSVTWALASPAHRAELEAAHSAAVVVALSHTEEHGPLVRRRVDGDIRHEQADGLAIARFRHHTSRVCAEQHEHGLAPDPQLHDHCAIANLALRKSDALAKNGDRWAAIDSRELFRVAAEAGAVYRAELAADLQQMGYRVHREGRYFEITGVSKEARRTFSQRAQEVEDPCPTCGLPADAEQLHRSAGGEPGHATRASALALRGNGALLRGRNRTTVPLLPHGELPARRLISPPFRPP